jgi:hypothetical protein
MLLSAKHLNKTTIVFNTKTQSKVDDKIAHLKKWKKKSKVEMKSFSNHQQRSA